MIINYRAAIQNIKCSEVYSKMAETRDLLLAALNQKKILV